MRLFVFECNKGTYGECLERNLFGTAKAWASHVSPDDPCLLFDYESDTIYGLWKAVSHCGTYAPEAWNGRFPKQVKVYQVSQTIHPVPKINVRRFVTNPPSGGWRTK